jgi:hypothetical protein
VAWLSVFRCHTAATPADVFVHHSRHRLRQ